MKRIYFALIAVSLMVMSTISCDRQDECVGVVVVMKSTDGTIDAGTPVPGCKVYIGEPNYSKDVYFVGTTDENGIVKNVWKNEANLGVRAVKDKMVGAGALNLRAGEVVEQVIWLKEKH